MNGKAFKRRLVYNVALSLKSFTAFKNFITSVLKNNADLYIKICVFSDKSLLM